MLSPDFVLVGVALQAVGGYSYLRDVLRGRVQPNKVSWLMWCIAPLVAFAAEVSQGVGIQSLTTFIVGFTPLVIFTASFFNRDAAWDLTRFDIACGVLSALGIALWAVTTNGNMAILFAIVADALAAVPTLRKAYSEPQSENDSVFICGVANAAVGLLVIEAWDFQHYAFPAYLLAVNALLAVLIRFKPGPLIAGRKERAQAAAKR